MDTNIISQKSKRKKILVSIALFILFVVAAGLFIYHYRDSIREKLTKSSIASNLPGALVGPSRTTRAEDLSAEKIIYWTNYYRNQNSLPSLTPNTVLTSAARTKTNDMFSKQYFEHVSPSGVSPADLVAKAGYKYKTTGENLALGDFTDEKDLVDAWMNSPGHRANILNKDYTEIGVASDLGKYQDRSSTWISVQEFGKPLPNCSSPNKSTLNDISTKKSQLASLNSQITTLSTSASNLNAQGNSKIQQGNDVFASTHDQSQAQPYWDEGQSLQDQAKSAEAQAKVLQSQAASLSSEINSESSSYNSTVDNYNACIAG